MNKVLCVMCRQNEAIHPDKPVCMGMMCQLMYNERMGLFDHKHPDNLCVRCKIYTTSKNKINKGRLCGRCERTMQIEGLEL